MNAQWIAPQAVKEHKNRYFRARNLMIDIIAQSGLMASTAKSISEFVVDGELRYWLHVAIDRFTGNVVDQQLEPVWE